MEFQAKRWGLGGMQGSRISALVGRREFCSEGSSHEAGEAECRCPAGLPAWEAQRLRLWEDNLACTQAGRTGHRHGGGQACPLGSVWGWSGAQWGAAG